MLVVIAASKEQAKFYVEHNTKHKLEDVIVLSSRFDLERLRGIQELKVDEVVYYTHPKHYSEIKEAIRTRLK